MAPPAPPSPQTPSTSAITPQTSRRRRARQACLACRQRKRKCDMQLPCSMCTTYSYKCQYGKDTGPSSAYVKRPRRTSDAAESRHESPTSAIRTVRTAVIAERRERSASPRGEPGILDPFKGRYMSQSSAVAFPRSLGVELGSANPPPLHSYGWNCGIRAEEKTAVHASLLNFVSTEAILRFSVISFDIVSPHFAAVNRQQFLQRFDGYAAGDIVDVAYGAVIAGVVALGSLFSASQGHSRELDIVQYAKSILDDPKYSRYPSMDQVAAWLLRTVYLRATTRPHSAWLASSITLHLAEAIGLHHDVNNLLLATSETSDPSISTSRSGVEHTSGLFWSVWTANVIISYEYGRSAIKISNITCAPVAANTPGFGLHFYQLAHLLPPAGTSHRKSELYRALAELDQVSDDHPFVTLTKADLCFCFYRRLRVLKAEMLPTVLNSVIRHGSATCVAAYQLASEGRPWWNLLGSVFQYICILIAIDSRASLRHVSGAIDCLERIVQILRTHMAVEALTTARLLLRDSMAKKRGELELLAGADTKELAPAEVVPDVDFDWDTFFQETYENFLGSAEGTSEVPVVSGTSG